MPPAAFVWGTLVSLTLAGVCAAFDPVTDGTPALPKFVVVASADDAEFGSSLFRVLRDKGERARFATAETIGEALAASADVLVLVLPRRELPPLEPESLAALRQRKIVGIGYGAAQLFGKLGLEINGGACAHGVQSPPMLTVMNNRLLGAPKTVDPLLVLQDEDLPEPGKLELFAMFLPPNGPDAAAVDALARWTSDPNYAPVVRQGNCVLVGIPVPATQWTMAYADFIRKVCLVLHERQVEPFAAARRQVTKPGVYKFQLAPRGSTGAAFDTTFYLKFAEPRKLSARLDHAGSNAVMLVFMGEDDERNHWTRQDARQGEPLQIVADITRDDIQQVGERYWKVNVTNFGATAAECQLTIMIEE